MFKVDREICIACEQCIKDCPVNDIYLKEGKAHIKNEACIKCGHCIAICPVKAVSTDDYDMDEVIEYKKEDFEIEPERLLNFIKFRRSVRRFKDKEVEKDKIEKIIEAGRFTQTGTNSQDVSYTVLQKDLPKISQYNVEKVISIGEDKVDGYHNDILDYDLVGLKDSDGNISYYIYKDGKYTLYKELTFNGMTLQLVLKDAPLGYKKTTFLYDGNKVDSYQEVKVDILKNTYAVSDNDITGNQYYLFYAKNVETGKENLYQYDALEKTVQRYNTQVLDMYKGARDTYYMYLLGAILLLGVVIVIFSIILILNGKKLKKK